MLFLFPYSPQTSTLIIHLTPPLRGRKKITFFSLSKPKSNEWRKRQLLWGSQPRGIKSCEIGAHLAWSQWFRWKIPLQSDTEITKTPCLKPPCFFHFHLHLLIIPLPQSLIHLSELFQVAASYLSLTPLPGFISVDILITDLKSNPFKIPPVFIHFSFLRSPPLLSCSFVLHSPPLRHYF